MILDVILNGKSMYEKGWIREKIDFPTPKPQSNTIVVPGRNTPIRYTEALGRTSYQPRSFTITLSMSGTREKFNEMVIDVANEYSGKLTRVVCSDSPDVFALGTLEVTPSYDASMKKGQLVLACSDGDSYLYHVDETEFYVYRADKTFEFVNDYMPVVPIITTTGDVDLSWSVGDENFQKTIGPGVWELPELEFQHGTNYLYIKTNDEITIVYREGRL